MTATAILERLDTRTRTRTQPAATTEPTIGPVALVVATRKGAFILRGDLDREHWSVSDPLYLGNVVHHVVLDPRDRRTMLMAASTGHLGPTIFRSTDGGDTWQEASRPPAFPKASEGEEGKAVHHNFWLSPGHTGEPGIWYVGTSPQGLFRSEDGGATWDGVRGFNDHPDLPKWSGGVEGAPPGGATVHSISIDPRDARHLYIGLSTGGLFESTDKGKTWRPLNKGCAADFIPTPDPEYGHDPHCVRMHPLDPDRLYQQNHCGIYRMDRRDGVWVRIGRNMPAEVGDIGFPCVVHPRDVDTVWVFPMDGTEVWPRTSPGGKPAAYVTRDGGNTWTRQNYGFPPNQAWWTVKR